MLSVKLNVLKSYVKRLGFSFVAVLSQSAFAEEVVKQQNLTANRPGNTPASDALMPMLLALLLVVFVIIVIAFVAKKLNLTPNNTGHFKLVSSMSLGGRERIIIIEVQGQQHAIGVTPQNVNHLFSLENPIESKTLPMANSTLVNKINKLFGYTPPQTDSNSTQKNG